MPFPYSSQSHTATASTGPFSYSNVSLLTDVPVKDQIKVYLNGQLKTLTTDYTLTAGETVTFNSAVTGTVKIARESDIENKEVTFTNSSVLTAQDLNKNSDQLLFLCQELYDKAQGIALTSTNAIPPNSISTNLLISDSGFETVTSSVIRDGAVTESKIAADAVTVNKIGNLAVSSAKIADNAVTYAKAGSDLMSHGSWTPVLKMVNSTGGLGAWSFRTSSFNSPVNGIVGKYVKMNKLVILHGRVQWDSVNYGNGSSADLLAIAGLPFPIDMTGGLHGHGSIGYWSSYRLPLTQMLGYGTSIGTSESVLCPMALNDIGDSVAAGGALGLGSNASINFLYGTYFPTSPSTTVPDIMFNAFYYTP